MSSMRVFDENYNLWWLWHTNPFSVIIGIGILWHLRAVDKYTVLAFDYFHHHNKSIHAVLGFKESVHDVVGFEKFSV